MIYALVILVLAALPTCYLMLRICWHFEGRELDWRYEDTMRRARETLDRAEQPIVRREAV